MVHRLDVRITDDVRRFGHSHHGLDFNVLDAFSPKKTTSPIRPTTAATSASPKSLRRPTTPGHFSATRTLARKHKREELSSAQPRSDPIGSFLLLSPTSSPYPNRTITTTTTSLRHRPLHQVLLTYTIQLWEERNQDVHGQTTTEQKQKLLDKHRIPIQNLKVWYKSKIQVIDSHLFSDFKTTLEHGSPQVLAN